MNMRMLMGIMLPCILMTNVLAAPKEKSPFFSRLGCAKVTVEQEKAFGVALASFVVLFGAAHCAKKYHLTLQNFFTHHKRCIFAILAAGAAFTSYWYFAKPRESLMFDCQMCGQENIAVQKCAKIYLPCGHVSCRDCIKRYQQPPLDISAACTMCGGNFYWIRYDMYKFLTDQPTSGVYKLCL